MAQGRKVVPIGGMPVAQPQVRNVNLAAIPGVEVPMDADAVDNAALQFSKALGELAPSLGALWQRVEEAKKKGSGKRARLAMRALTGKFGFSIIQKFDREKGAAWFKAKKEKGDFNIVPYDPTARDDDWLNFKVLAGKRYLANSGYQSAFEDPKIIARFADPHESPEKLEQYINDTITEITEDMNDPDSAPFLLGVLSQLQEGADAWVPKLRKRVDAQRTKNASNQFASDAVAATEELIEENFYRDYLDMKTHKSYFKTDAFKDLNVDQKNVQIEKHNRIVADLQEHKKNLAFGFSELLNGPANIGPITPMGAILQGARLQGIAIVNDTDDGDFRAFIDFLKDIPIMNLDGTVRGTLGEDHRFKTGLIPLERELQTEKNKKKADKGVSTPMGQQELKGLLLKEARRQNEATRGLNAEQAERWIKTNKEASEIVSNWRKRTGIDEGAEYLAILDAAGSMETRNTGSLRDNPTQRNNAAEFIARISRGEGSIAAREEEFDEGIKSGKFGNEGAAEIGAALDDPFNQLKATSKYRSMKAAMGDLVLSKADEGKHDATTASSLRQIREAAHTAFDEKLKSFETDDEGSAEDKRKAWLDSEADAFGKKWVAEKREEIQNLQKKSLVQNPSQFMDNEDYGGKVRENIELRIRRDYKSRSDIYRDEDDKEVTDSGRRSDFELAVNNALYEIEDKIKGFIHTAPGEVNPRLRGLNDLDTRREILKWLVRPGPNGEASVVQQVLKKQLDPKLAKETFAERSEWERRVRARFLGDQSPAELAENPGNFGGVKPTALQINGTVGAYYGDAFTNYHAAGTEFGKLMSSPDAEPVPTESWKTDFKRMLSEDGSTGQVLPYHVAYLALLISDPEKYREDERYWRYETEQEDWGNGASNVADVAGGLATLTGHVGYLLQFKGISIEELKKDQLATGGVSLKKIWIDEKTGKRDIPFQVMPIGPYGDVNDKKVFTRWMEDAHKKVENRETGKVTTVLMPISEWSDENPYKDLVTDILDLSEKDILVEGVEEGLSEVHLFWSHQARLRNIRSNTEEGIQAKIDLLDRRMHFRPKFTARAADSSIFGADTPWMIDAINNSKAFNK